jgi:hypothetical protein
MVNSCEEPFCPAPCRPQPSALLWPPGNRAGTMCVPGGPVTRQKTQVQRVALKYVHLGFDSSGAQTASGGNCSPGHERGQLADEGGREVLWRRPTGPPTDTTNCEVPAAWAAGTLGERAWVPRAPWLALGCRIFRGYCVRPTCPVLVGVGRRRRIRRGRQVASQAQGEALALAWGGGNLSFPAPAPFAHQAQR